MNRFHDRFLSQEVNTQSLQHQLAPGRENHQCRTGLKRSSRFLSCAEWDHHCLREELGWLGRCGGMERKTNYVSCIWSQYRPALVLSLSLLGEWQQKWAFWVIREKVIQVIRMNHWRSHRNRYQSRWPSKAMAIRISSTAKSAKGSTTTQEKLLINDRIGLKIALIFKSSFEHHCQHLKSLKGWFLLLSISIYYHII